jgi:hypothetical protein
MLVFGDDKGKGEFDEANLYSPFLKPGKSLATSHSWTRKDNGVQNHYKHILNKKELTVCCHINIFK